MRNGLVVRGLRWSVIRCSYDDHSNLFWGEVTWRDLVTWPWVTWVWNWYKMCGKDVWTGVPKRRRRAPPFFEISPKPLRGCLNIPGPARSYSIRSFAALQLFWFPSYVPIFRKMLNSAKFDLRWPLDELTFELTKKKMTEAVSSCFLTLFWMALTACR